MSTPFPGKHPAYASDCPFGTSASCSTGVGVLSIFPRIPSRTHPPGHYWVLSRSLVPGVADHFRSLGYAHIYFTPYTSRENWERYNPTVPLEARPIIPRPPPPPSSPFEPTPSRHPPSSGTPLPMNVSTPHQSPSNSVSTKSKYLVGSTTDLVHK